jgi:methylation protein EvaC
VWGYSPFRVLWIGVVLKCRICGGISKAIVNFGRMPIANDFLFDLRDDTYRFTLSTSFCELCSLFQIDEQPRPELMFHDHYPFFTGLSASMKSHFGKFVDFHLSKANKELNDLFIVEIGSNDGTLLEFVKSKEVRHLGIDPSSNVVEKAREKGVSAEVGFFGENLATNVVKRHGQADYIFAANVICHIPNLIDFGNGIKNLLASDGQFIFEEPYIGSMIENTSYDQVYDEHVYIFGAISVRNIFSRVGLELVDAIPQVTHGGSMRYILMHKGIKAVSKGLEEILAKEKMQGLHQVSTYLEFAQRCEERRFQFKSLLEKLKSQGSLIAGYAATSKSTTVLNYCGIGPDLISYISDSTIEKQGRYTPGSHIPVKPPDEIRKNLPDYLVLFAWNHEEEILEKEIALTRAGVKWIRFVPKVEILEAP